MMESKRAEKLAVLWVTGDADAAHNMILMYARNAKTHGWWPEVHLILWGPSSELVATDEEIAEECRTAAKEGLTLLACKACADRIGVSDRLSEIGFDVKYMGQPLTEMLQSPQWRVLSI